MRRALSGYGLVQGLNIGVVGGMLTFLPRRAVVAVSGLALVALLFP